MSSSVLDIGVTFDIFNLEGYFPVSTDVLNILVSDSLTKSFAHLSIKTGQEYRPYDITWSHHD